MRPPLEVRADEVTYILRCGDYVKIGHSVDPQDRMRKFAPGNPFDITLVTTFPLGEMYERFLHARFKGHWHRDEWFRIEGALADWLESGCPHKQDIRALLQANREHAKKYELWRAQVKQKKEAMASKKRQAVKMAEEKRRWERHDAWLAEQSEAIKNLAPGPKAPEEHYVRQ